MKANSFWFFFVFCRPDNFDTFSRWTERGGGKEGERRGQESGRAYQGKTVKTCSFNNL